jgi:hypothetical protein
MSDWNQYPDWHPLEWADLNQQKQQGISNTIGDFFNKAYDVFKQRSQNDWEVNTLLPAQTSAQEGLASFTNQLPMTAAESATSGNQTSELEETKTYHRNLEKIMNDQNLSEAERSAARDAETERHNKADEDIATDFRRAGYLS